MTDQKSAKEHFNEIVDAPVEARSAYLAVHCNDPTLRNEVQALLDAYDGAQSFMSRPAAELLERSASASQPDVSPPSKIGDYEVIDTIGRGGMGVVYRAKETALGRLVALKVLLPAYASSETSIARFRHEARAVAKLNHPGIAPIYRFGEVDGHHYIAMELIEGPSLAVKLEGVREVIDESGRSPRTTVKHLNEAARMISQVADALEYAHQAKLIHRDVKPSNILIDEHGRPHLVDFGIAKDLAADTLTIAGGVAGTCRYMSPEQADAANVEIDHRSDIFSLGVVLYEAITLHLPFDGETPQQVLSQVISKRPRNVRACNPAISKDLETICHKALEKDPKDRYQTAAHMAADLRCYLTGDPILARPPGLARRARRLVRRKRRVLAIAAMLSLAVLFSLEAMVAASAEARALALKRRQMSELVLEPCVTNNRVEIVTLSRFGEIIEERILAATNEEHWLDPGLYRFIITTSDDSVHEVTRPARPGQPVGVLGPRVSPDVSKMILVRGGTFRPFGELEDHDRHVSAFYLDRTEVSNREFRVYREESGDTFVPKSWPEWYLDESRQAPPDWIGNDTLDVQPVTGVPFDRAQAYAEWNGKRLPTLLELEFAAQGSERRRFAWGDDPTSAYAVPDRLLGDFYRSIRPESRYALLWGRVRAVHDHGGDVSPDGIYHLWGNVSEWTESFSDDSLDLVFYFGGAYFNSPTAGCEEIVHARKDKPFHTGSDDVGFRCALSVNNANSVEGDT